MGKMDEGQKATYRELTEIEKRINREYAEAIRGIEDTLADYLRRYEVKDKRWREWVESGEKTVEEYKQWRIGQMAVGKRWADQKEAIAEGLFKVNSDLRDYIKSEMPQIYADNYNFATYQVEKGAHIDTGFTLYNKEAVENILKEDADVLKGPGRRVKGLITQGKAVAWDKKQLQSVMVQGILQGDSIPKLATRLANRVGESDRKAAIRNARTMATGAQNAGRTAAYKRAEDLGVDVTQMWMAVNDNRTRHSHRWLDGEERPVGEAFSNGCEYPGDPKGDPAEIYNCRCTLRGVVKGLERRAYKYKDSKIDGMTYDEWLNAKPEYNPITLPEEKGKAIKGAWIKKYRENGIINSDTSRAKNPFKGSHSRFGELSADEYAEAQRLKKELPEIELEPEEYKRVVSSFNENLSNEQRESSLVDMAVNDYHYYAVNLGFNNYHFYNKKSIDPTYDDVVDEVLTEMFGKNWKKDWEEWNEMQNSNKSL